MRRTRTPGYIIWPSGLIAFVGIWTVIEVFVGHMPWIIWPAFGFIWGTFLYSMQHWITDDIMDKRWKEWETWLDASNERMLDHMAALRQRRSMSTDPFGAQKGQQGGQQKAGGMPVPPPYFGQNFGATFPPAPDAQADRYV